MKPVKKLTMSAMVIALYFIVMYLTQSFSFGQYQIRVATSMYSLSYFYPFLIIPLGISNLLSNMVGPLGMYDMIGGMIVGIITSSLVYLIRRLRLNDWFITLPIILGPGLLVPIWLSYLLKLPYIALVISVSGGQVIPSVMGVFIVKYLRKNRKSFGIYEAK